jgi:hypothetical protein
MSHTPTDLLLACLQFDDPAARLARLSDYRAAEWQAVLDEGQRLGGKSAEAARFILRAISRELDSA